MTAIVLPFPDDHDLARDVARRLHLPLGALEWRHFPDGESLVTMESALEDRDVVLFASLRDPDRKALPLRFVARTAKEFGARRVGLVAPYLAYMRQDARFHAGETVNARWFAEFISETVDWLVTVDPHLHRIPRLDALFRFPTTHVRAAPLLARWIHREVPSPALIGPDEESAQWVSEIAGGASAPFQILQKIRHGDRSVAVSVPDVIGLRGRTPVLVDDMVSSGATLIAATSWLRQLGLAPPVCVVIHGVFAGDAYSALQAAGAVKIVSTDSIKHSSNAIGLAPLIADAVGMHLGGGQ
jgi:ribose-phosphate pyrophosphokinase